MLLVIESATAACSVALIDGHDVVAQRHEIVGRGHAERLVPMIGEMLGGVKPSAVLVDCGPGSFTGIRVGLAAAHGLAIGWDVPVAGFTSMALIAAAAGTNSELAVAVEGGHGQLFVQSYGRPLAPLDDLRSLPPAEAATAISAQLVVGSAAGALVALRGYGEARDAIAVAADACLLPDALRALPARPIYGRAPDAKPMAAR
jgi:tRNA threonylcarbamoyl adenosine modification protein YeaZ